MPSIISKFAASQFPLPLAQIPSKSDYAIKHRCIAAVILHQVEHLTQTQIASILHHSQSSISRLLRNHPSYLQTDPAYRTAFNEYKHRYLQL